MPTLLTAVHNGCLTKWYLIYFQNCNTMQKSACKLNIGLVFLNNILNVLLHLFLLIGEMFCHVLYKNS